MNGTARDSFLFMLSIIVFYFKVNIDIVGYKGDKGECFGVS